MTHHHNTPPPVQHEAYAASGAPDMLLLHAPREGGDTPGTYSAMNVNSAGLAMNAHEFGIQDPNITVPAVVVGRGTEQHAVVRAVRPDGSKTYVVAPFRRDKTNTRWEFTGRGTPLDPGAEAAVKNDEGAPQAGVKLTEQGGLRVRALQDQVHLTGDAFIAKRPGTSLRPRVEPVTRSATPPANIPSQPAKSLETSREMPEPTPVAVQLGAGAVSLRVEAPTSAASKPEPTPIQAEAVAAPAVQAEVVAAPESQSQLMPETAEDLRALLDAGNESARNVVRAWLWQRSSQAITAIWEAEGPHIRETLQNEVFDQAQARLATIAQGARPYHDAVDALRGIVASVTGRGNLQSAADIAAQAMSDFDRFLADNLLTDEQHNEAASAMATVRDNLNFQRMTSGEQAEQALDSTTVFSLTATRFTDPSREQHANDLMTQLVTEGAGRDLETYGKMLTESIPKDYAVKLGVLRTAKELVALTNTDRLRYLRELMDSLKSSSGFGATVRNIANQDYNLNNAQGMLGAAEALEEIFATAAKEASVAERLRTVS